MTMLVQRYVRRMRSATVLSCLVVVVLLSPMPGFSGDWTLLSGKHLDVLVNLGDGAVRGLAGKQALSGVSEAKMPGALVSDGMHVWAVYAGQLVSLVDGTVLRIPGNSLLPVPSVPSDFQHLLIDNRIQIPTTEGVAVLDPRTGDWYMVPVPVVLPEQGSLSVAPARVYPGEHHTFRTGPSDISIRESGGKWRTVADAGDERKLHAMTGAGERWITLAISRIGTEGLGSFHIRVMVLDRQTGKLAVDHSGPGILRGLFVDQAGRPTIYYTPASILTALFSRERMFLRTFDPETDDVGEQSIKLSHKRRQVLPIRNNGKLELVVQCKDGIVCRVNPGDGSVMTLRKGVPYDHRIARFRDHLEILDNRNNPVDRIDLFPDR